MYTGSESYDIFFRFIETYSHSGFTGIDRNDLLIVKLEELTEQNDQFFYAGDIMQMKFFFTSKRSIQMMGVDPDVLSPYHFFEATHTDDMERQTLGRAKLFKLAHDLYMAEKGFTIFSTNFKIRNPGGNYSNLLFQMYLFYSTIPYKSVFLLKIHTNIDGAKKMKRGFHYYLGNDLSNFRYPDEELLSLGIPFSDREFEIIRLVESGLNSEQIADKLFLSVHTVNTHRKNILAKAEKPSMSELIYDLMISGVL
jgi:hypothetical protein